MASCYRRMCILEERDTKESKNTQQSYISNNKEKGDRERECVHVPKYVYSDLRGESNTWRRR